MTRSTNVLWEQEYTCLEVAGLVPPFMRVDWRKGLTILHIEEEPFVEGHKVIIGIECVMNAIM